MKHRNFMREEVWLERMDPVRVKTGDCKPFRCQITGIGFDHFAEGDTPQEALVLAAMHWHKHQPERSDEDEIGI